jgi:hypothetical protein
MRKAYGVKLIRKIERFNRNTSGASMDNFEEENIFENEASAH